MVVKINDVFSISSGNYIALEDIVYENARYIFTNKLDDLGEATQNFLVFRCSDNGLILEKNKNKLDILLKYFSEKANDKLELIYDFKEKRGDK